MGARGGYVPPHARARRATKTSASASASASGVGGARALDGLEKEMVAAAKKCKKRGADVAEGFAAWIISRNLASFHRQHPAIRIELVATNGFLNPSKREADLAIMLSRPTAGPLKVRKLVDYQLGVYADRDYLASAGPIASVDDLRRHPLIGYIPDFIYADELRYLDEIGPERLGEAQRCDRRPTAADDHAGGWSAAGR